MSAWAGRSEFLAAVDSWGSELGVEPQSVALRAMKRKWASCSAAGRLIFDDELVAMEKEFGEYVILHELLHLRYKNHGSLFTAFLSSYMPDWRKRAALAAAREL